MMKNLLTLFFISYLALIFWCCKIKQIMLTLRPVLYSKKQLEPNVHFATPAVKHSWPTKAPWWSPMHYKNTLLITKIIVTW